MLFAKSKKQLLLIVLAIISATLISACSKDNENLNQQEDNQVKKGYIDETVLLVQDMSEVDKVRSRMTKMLSNEYAELYMGEAYDIALIDIRTNKVWYSNEAIYDEGVADYSAEQKKYVYSQVIIDYYRKDHKQISVTSYPECYDGEDKNQITANVKDNILSVKYSFGTDMKGRVIFQVISAERYEEMEQLAKKAIEEKTISSSAWGRMKVCYIKSDDGKYYELTPKATYIQTDNIEKVCKSLGYTRTDVDEEEKNIGVSAELEAAVPNFEITVNYQLEQADLLVSVDTREIYEPSDVNLGCVSVLPGFGANTNSDDGYVVYIDGNGAIIQNDSIALTATQERVVFYGDDAAMIKDTISERSIASSFPVFGIKTGNASLFAIVESGDAVSGVDVMRINQIRTRNMMAPLFYYRVRGRVSTGNISEKGNWVYSDSITEEPYVIRYHMLYDTRATYSGMADYYRSYLVANDALRVTENGSNWYTDVNCIGGIKGMKTVMGISFDTVLAASEYTSVQEWITDVEIENLSINYEGMFNGGVDGKAPLKLKPISALGNDTERDELLKNDFVYPTISLQTVGEEGNGIDGSSDIAKSINKGYAFEIQYNPATGQRTDEMKSFLISPFSYKKIGTGFVEAYSEYNSKKLLVENVGSLLYSDFNKKRSASREESKVILCNVLEQLQELGLHLKIDGINSYALKYGEAFTNVPTDHSSQLKDSGIPFVGMILHGSIPYSVKPLNESENYQTALLDMIECGANPSWRIITGDVSILSDTDYTCYYSASADYWTDEIKALDERLQSFYQEVSEETIIDHSILPNGLIQVTYSNGYQAYINKTARTLTTDSVSVGSNSFYLCNEKGEVR